MFSTNETIRMSPSSFIRRRPPLSVQRGILDAQANRCYYCDRPFGSSVIRRGRLTILKAVWDHYIPFAYRGSNPAENFVAACQVCNGFKSSMIFETREEAQLYLRRRWALDQSVEDLNSEPAGGATASLATRLDRGSAEPL